LTFIMKGNAAMLARKRNFSAAVILILLAGVQAQHSVTLSSQSLCAVTGSTVKIPCTFTTPDHSSVTQREWYRVQSSEGEPQDLSTDAQYSGRVSVSTVTSDCELTVRNVRVSDSGVYNFRFKTERSDWISASSGFNLTVTDLSVTVSNFGKNKKKLRCSATCTLSNNPKYIWYKNGLHDVYQVGIELPVSEGSWDPGSYSCAVRGHEDLRSPAVCVYDQNSCWSVTYSTNTICSLIGSSVDIHSYYTFPGQYNVTNVFWFIKERTGAEPVDVREDEAYQGRVQYTQSSQNNCSLRITNLTERDAQTYRFRFLTNDTNGKYTGQPGVSLSVTDLKVTVSDWRDQYTTLSCITTCTLSNTPTYIWYKNGQRVSDCKSASCSVAAVSGAASYSCAVEGHDSLLSPPVYSPKNTSAVLLSSGDTVEGDSVTLSCSSDANPPVLNYTWFKQRAAADTLLTTGQKYSISNISSQHSGLYYCTAHNQLGHHNSTPTELDVLYAPRITNVTAVPSVSGDSITLLCKSDSNPISNYTWTRRTEGGVKLTGNGNNLTLHSGADGLYVCTATNQLGSSDSSGWEYTADNRAVKYAGTAVTVALVLIFITVILWLRRRASAVCTKSEEHSKNDSVNEYDNLSAMTSDPTQTASSENQDNVQYSTVSFSQHPTNEVPLYSTVQLPKAVKQEEEVEYGTVSCAKPRAAGFITPDRSSVTQREWYRVQSSEREPRDLSTDPRYSERVSVSTVTSDCKLTVRNVRVSDSGVYNFRFKTEKSEWISDSSGFNLTVTDLKVIVSDSALGKKLSCITTCTLPNNFYWYKNERRIPNQNSNVLLVSVSRWDRDSSSVSYSCAVRGHENLRSPVVCAGCWSVTYSTQTICSLIGSSVDIHSYYTLPYQYKVTEVFWFVKDQTDGEPVDMREKGEYQGRVQYIQSSKNNCILKITNLRERDAQTYRFRFLTNDPTGKYTGQPGVSLSVTDLKVTVSNWSNGVKKLSCITTCNLSNNPNYIWYKNGQRVAYQYRNELNVNSWDAGSYSCAVRGHENLRSPAVYSPKNTRAVLLSSGDTVEGDSVTLSCSSDANPPVLTYSWFKQRTAEDTLLTTDQNYSISNISSQHSGLYYCTAHNQLGQHSSTPTHLDVL
ncbi:B-cell receptor CD22-like, partial [Clarias magur]